MRSRDQAALFEQSMSRRYGRPFHVSDRYVRFMTEVSLGWLERGWLRLAFLDVDGRRVAFGYRALYGETVYALQTAFDEDWAAYHVGQVVNGYVIERAIAEGCTKYDFGPGQGEHKSELGATEDREITDARVYGTSAPARASFAYDATARWGRRALKRVSPPPVLERLTKSAGWKRLEGL